MIVALNTSTMTAELYLFDGQQQVEEHIWQADRMLASQLLPTLVDVLGKHSTDISGIHGIIVYRGPGSFTGLRIGCTVMNTLAYSNAIPIVGALGDNWLQDGLDLLQDGVDQKTVMPEYGAPARITQPRK